jgi:hypothetical protein
MLDPTDSSLQSNNPLKYSGIRGTDCDELEGRSAREMVVYALFGFLTQQVMLFTCSYIGKIDNACYLSVAVTPEENGYKVKYR